MDALEQLLTALSAVIICIGLVSALFSLSNTEMVSEYRVLRWLIKPRSFEPSRTFYLAQGLQQTAIGTFLLAANLSLGWAIKLPAFIVAMIASFWVVRISNQCRRG